MEKIIQKFKKGGALISTFVFFGISASTNYQLKGYEVGGSGGVSSSTNYSAEGSVGQAAGKQASTNFGANTGLVYTQQTNTPAAPTFQNNGNWYNKLFFIINTSGNPTDTTYAIAISDDNWATTKYVQTDNTVGTSFGIANFQTYAAWGGGSGGYIIGLAQNTTYKIKVKARQGVYTEGPWGPEASVATSPVSLTTDIDIAATDQETSPPYSVAIGSLTAGSITTATDQIWIDLDTNAANGGVVFINDQNTGLTSSSTSYTIVSSTSDLSVQSSGFGLQGNSVTQTSGGPFSFQSPYNGSAQNVGIVDTTLRPILSTNNPIVGGRASIYVKAKVSSTTPAADDYTDLFTVIAAGSF